MTRRKVKNEKKLNGINDLKLISESKRKNKAIR
jgi:hypothetical protein